MIDTFIFLLWTTKKFRGKIDKKGATVKEKNRHFDTCSGHYYFFSLSYHEKIMNNSQPKSQEPLTKGWLICKLSTFTRD